MAAPSPSNGDTAYSGLVTRALAFLIDIGIIDLVAVVVAAAAALVISFFAIPSGVQTVLKLIGAGVAVVWAAGYFIFFWATTGQTPGNRVMQIRVTTAKGDPVKPRIGVIRCVGLVLAALPLFAGYALILFDRRRRGFQDRLARTVVVDAPDLSLAELRRTGRNASDPAGPARTAGVSPGSEQTPTGYTRRPAKFPTTTPITVTRYS